MLDGGTIAGAVIYFTSPVARSLGVEDLDEGGAGTPGNASARYGLRELTVRSHARTGGGALRAGGARSSNGSGEARPAW
jgi:hypothetical protein